MLTTKIDGMGPFNELLIYWIVCYFYPMNPDVPISLTIHETPLNVEIHICLKKQIFK